MALPHRLTCCGVVGGDCRTGCGCADCDCGGRGSDCGSCPDRHRRCGRPGDLGVRTNRMKRTNCCYCCYCCCCYSGTCKGWEDCEIDCQYSVIMVVVGKLLLNVYHVFFCCLVARYCN